MNIDIASDDAHILS